MNAPAFRNLGYALPERLQGPMMSNDARELLKVLLQREHQKNMPSIGLDDFFEIYSAEQVLKSRGYDPETSEVQSGIMGQGHAKDDPNPKNKGPDGGVDAFYVFANRKLIREDTDISQFAGQQLTIDVVIIQSKNAPSFTEDAFDKLNKFVRLCLRFHAPETEETKTLYKESLREAVKRFHEVFELGLTEKPNLSIAFYYASLGEQISSGVEAGRQLLRAEAAKAYPIGKVTVDTMGAKAILELAIKPPERSFTLKTTKYASMGNGAWVCLVELGRYYEFIDDNGQPRDVLFESNVRDHEGDVNVNKGIAATLSAPGNEDFWWLNNGITMIASKVIPTSPVFTITDPRIVNGLQTSYQIHQHLKPLEDKTDTRHILVRLFETDKESTIDNIITATNSQTKISGAWLHAGDPVQRNIEIAFANSGLLYERRKNFYRNRGEPLHSIVTLPYLGQALTAIVLQRPDDARSRPTTAVNRHYSRLFPKRPVYELYVKCAQIMKRVDSFLDRTGLERGLKLNLVFYLAFYATHVALRSAKPRRQTIASFDLSLLDDLFLSNMTGHLLRQFASLFHDDKAAKSMRIIDLLRDELEHRFGSGKHAPIMEAEDGEE